jgi:hypothetical protein
MIHRGLPFLCAAGLLAGCAARPAQETPGLSATPAAHAATASPTPTTSPILSPSPATDPVAGWSLVADLGEGGGWDFATSVARGRDAFVALGARVERAPEVIFIQPREYLWVSDDGRTWEEVPMDPEFVGARFIDVIATGDGGFVVFGVGQLTALGWRSDDGRNWKPIDTTLGPDQMVEQVVHGARGYLLKAYHNPSSDRSLWHSTDGLSWEEVQHFPARSAVVGAIGAGDEGFVAAGSRLGPDGLFSPMVFASADGLTWLEAPQSFGLTAETTCFEPVLTPFGGDWIAVIALLDGSATVWSSANGLDWESVGSMANLGTTPCGPPGLTYAGGRLLLSPSVAFDSLSSVVWSSSDGRTWEPWEPGADAAVIAAIDSPAGSVAVGAAVRGADASLASFWFSPASAP